MMPVGWKYESARHSLAARGVKTGRRYNFDLSAFKLGGRFSQVGAGMRIDPVYSRSFLQRAAPIQRGGQLMTLRGTEQPFIIQTVPPVVAPVAPVVSAVPAQVIPVQAQPVVSPVVAPVAVQTQPAVAPVAAVAVIDPAFESLKAGLRNDIMQYGAKYSGGVANGIVDAAEKKLSRVKHDMYEYIEHQTRYHGGASAVRADRVNEYQSQINAQYFRLKALNAVADEPEIRAAFRLSAQRFKY